MEEVEFYQIDDPYKDMRPSDFLSMLRTNDNWLPLNNVKTAKFIGTDYDFIHNSELRETIFNNCIDEDKDLIQLFAYSSVDPSLEHLLNSSEEALAARFPSGRAGAQHARENLENFMRDTRNRLMLSVIHRKYC